MSYSLDLSYYEHLIYPIICQLSAAYHVDTDLLERSGQLMLWQIMLHYPDLLADERRLIGYVQEGLCHYVISAQAV